MNINSTLLVQMANVVVAYILFDLILIRPLTRIMQQEDAAEKQLLMTIQQAQDAIKIQELEFDRQKKEWRLRLTSSVPSVRIMLAPIFEIPLEKELELGNGKLDKLVSTLAQYMIEKVGDECITHE